MVKRKEKERALKLRMEGMSYSQIKTEIKVSKSTLSLWLRDFPLSEDRIRMLRDNNQARIEHCRLTKQKNKEKRLASIYTTIAKEIGLLSDREIKLCGLFLYWAEGTKMSSGSVVISNTDPAMIQFYYKYLLLLSVPKDKIKVRIQLYKDMDVEREFNFWSRTLNIDLQNFSKPYIKESTLIGLTYKNGHGHGTCSLMVYDVNLYNYIIMSIKYIKDSLS